jgi:hypothetical protein
MKGWVFRRVGDMGGIEEIKGLEGGDEGYGRSERGKKK